MKKLVEYNHKINLWEDLDYRYLNEYTIKNAYPLSQIDELVNSPAGMKLFIKMDI